MEELRHAGLRLLLGVPARELHGDLAERQASHVHVAERRDVAHDLAGSSIAGDPPLFWLKTTAPPPSLPGHV